jgi:hypothetical protein
MFRHLFNRAIFVGATFGNARWELSTGNLQALISLVVRKCVVPCWMVDAKTSHMKAPSLRAT